MSPTGFGAELGVLFGGTTNPSVSNLITYALTAAGINHEDDDYRARALVFLNFAYLNRLKGRHWKFTHRDLFIDLKAPYAVGTVVLTEASHIVEEDTAPQVLQFNSTMVGQNFAPGVGNEDLYRVSAVNTNKKLTLASKFAGSTAAGAAYSILFDRIALESGVQAVRSVLLSGIGELKPTGIQEFRNRKSTNPTLKGPPEWFTVINAEKDTGQWTLELYPSPDKRYSCNIDYSVRPVGLTDEDDCFTLIPPDQLDVLYYQLLADIYGYQENAAMADRVGKIAANSWIRFASDQEMTDSMARIQPARRHFNRRRGRYPGYYGLKWFGRVED